MGRNILVVEDEAIVAQEVRRTFLALLPEQSLSGARECMERVSAAVVALPTGANGVELAS